MVDGALGQVSLGEAENLRGLSVELRSCDASQAEALLGDLGRLDGDHIWLDIGLLKALSPLAGDTEWADGFDGVMKYAESKGWLDGAGTHVRAHIG